MTISRSYYELLGVSRSADPKTLRLAFCRLSKVLHPDTTTLPTDEASTSFQELCKAYAILSDPVTRKAYDLKLDQQFLFAGAEKKEIYDFRNTPLKISRPEEVRRSLSGGELFSLLLLAISLVLSLLLGIGFAAMGGRDWQVQPSWLTVELNPQQEKTFLPTTH